MKHRKIKSEIAFYLQNFDQIEYREYVDRQTRDCCRIIEKESGNKQHTDYFLNYYVPKVKIYDILSNDGMTKLVKLCIFDPIQAYLGGDTDMNRANEAREMTKKLGSIAERTGCAIVLIGHMNKGSGAKAAYRGMGSIDFFAVARSVMLVGRIEGQSNLRAMIQIKNNLAAFGHPKAFELAEDGFHWLGDYEITADEVLGGMVPKASKLEMAKQFLREQAERTQKILSTEIIELAAQEGISKRTLETAKKELKIKAERCNNNWYWNLRA